MRRFSLYFLLLLTLPLAGCSPFSSVAVLNPKGEQAKEQVDLITLSISLMALVFLVVLILFIRFVYKYRQRPGYTPDPIHQNRNKKFELIWTISPFIILFILAVPMIQTTFGEEQESKSPSDLTVKVTASHYWWRFEYPGQGIETAEELHLPKGKKVTLVLHSTDVIHSFWVPQLGGKLDVIPGRTNKLSLTPLENGTYQGKCAELCGKSHANMRFKVKVENEDDFNSWIAGLKSGNQTQSLSKSEAEGKSLFNENCLTCHAVEAQVENKKGPNLAGFAERERVAGILPNTKEHLEDWMKDPQKFKPGSEMPKVKGLDKKEYEKLAEYLQTLH
ncbi:cytochrome c oxidase subunit II [Peribacillus kribbensis]|uniref:cytochrome c oxidase subunit II n=1 Tax=Peribacillus kribbensis TaxID=356658 RepID=UPI000425B1D5|nr:cytochrome c oxidase subunit II [Peribacillus kribbensis]